MKITVCPKTAKTGTDGTAWGCILATGHGGHCKPNIDANHYDRPISERDRDWLLSELYVWMQRYESLEREHNATAGRDRELLRQTILRLIRIAPANATRKTVPLNEVRSLWQDALNRQVAA